MPETKILILGVFPRGNKGNTPDRIKVKKMNRYIAKLNDPKRVFFLDIGHEFLAKDGSLKKGAMTKDALHPALKGYQIWAKAIQETINELSEKSYK